MAHAASAPSHSSTSVSLLVSLRAQQPEGWNRFVELYCPLIYSWCRRAGVPQADAPDLTQQVALKVFTGIHGFELRREGGSFRGWLHAIARNAAADYFRSERGKLATAAGGTEAWQVMAQTPDDHAAPTSAGIAPDLRRVAERAMRIIEAELPPQGRQLFELVVLQGLSAAEAAPLLGQSASAVRQAKSRLLRRLREVLGEVE